MTNPVTNEARARALVLDAFTKNGATEEPDGTLHLTFTIADLEAAIAAALEEAEMREREACAKIADRWGAGAMIVQDEPGRSRYSRHDLQTYTNVAGRGIAEDIRSRTQKETPNA
jgi:hypothetical protein